MRVLMIFLLAFIVCGCTNPPISTQKINNITVEFLFEADGVKVYRFEDNGHYYYFTSHGETLGIEHYGKGQTKDAGVF